MTEANWEKTAETTQLAQRGSNSQRRYGYMVLGFSLLVIVAFLLVNGTATGRFFVTVDELVEDSNNIGKNVRVAGAVDGTTIQFNTETNTLSFTVVNITNDNGEIRDQGGLGAVLHNALKDPDATRLNIVWENGEWPDLLQHEAQAIMTGTLDENGLFHANQVLLKCPTRYSDDVPSQSPSTS